MRVSLNWEPSVPWKFWLLSSLWRRILFACVSYVTSSVVPLLPNCTCACMPSLSVLRVSWPRAVSACNVRCQKRRNRARSRAVGVGKARCPEIHRRYNLNFKFLIVPTAYFYNVHILLLCQCLSTKPPTLLAPPIANDQNQHMFPITAGQLSLCSSKIVCVVLFPSDLVILLGHLQFTLTIAPPLMSKRINQSIVSIINFRAIICL